MNDNLDSLRYLDEKRFATALDMNALADEVQKEVYLNKINELKKENQVLLDKLEQKNNQLNYFFQLYNTDASVFDDMNLDD